VCSYYSSITAHFLLNPAGTKWFLRASLAQKVRLLLEEWVMKKRLIGLAAAALLLTVLVIFPAGAQDSNSDGVSLTIYNQGTALVQDRRTFDLQQGVNTLDFTDVAASIDSTSVSFRSLTDPTGTSVLEQNYVYDLVGSSALLERYLDQRIEVITN